MSNQQLSLLNKLYLKGGFNIAEREIWKLIDQSVVPYIAPWFWISSHGRVYSSRTDVLLQPTSGKGGYLWVCLTLHTPNGRKQIVKCIHRLVLKTFRPIINDHLYDGHHKDTNPKNNHLNNLEWMIKKDHVTLSVSCREQKNISGSLNPMSKLKEYQVIDIVDLINEGRLSFVEIASIYNISESAIQNIASGRTWREFVTDISPRISDSFTNQELKEICRFFESVDINDKAKYPSKNSLFKDCFETLGLDLKYKLEEKRKTMGRILTKSNRSHKLSIFLNSYSYNYSREKFND